MTDPFRPRSEPAKTFYDTFQDEADLRNGRNVAEWQPKEEKTEEETKE